MFNEYSRKTKQQLRPYLAGETLPDYVSISAADRANGSPKEGDMIARNPKDHNDQWLVAKEYFEDPKNGYELIGPVEKAAGTQG